MSYVNSVLQPGERVVVSGRLHWIVYWHAIVLLVLGVALLAWEHSSDASALLMEITAIIFAVLIGVSFLHAWYIRWITEIAVTNRRVIYKQGFFTRRTVEINMDKVASVDVDQNLMGRLLDYGTVNVVGTGGAQNVGGAEGGIKDLDRIASPLAFRNAITAK
jgi:uncharacterized membrane protein YdbT with pleckstrin-like domain